MLGKTVVITGATSGIGSVAGRRLAQLGARIVFVARDRQRAQETLRELRAAGAGQAHTAFYADLSRLSEMKRVAAEIAAAEPKIDVLMNNAGLIASRNQRTEDGLELMLATNHLSYFVLTNLLLERLRAAGGARVVSTASEAHRRGRLDFARMQELKGAAGYGTTKLCNILFTRELARRIAGSGVTANCLHPGFVATRFGDSAGGALHTGLAIAKRLFALSPEDGAKTMVYLATSAEVAGRSGGYYDRCAPSEPSRAARNDADAKRLWELSAEITGIGAEAAC
ncbi:MAG TPA: SDR family oxidoreductase [Steroidobacteraceae bacterium]|jgi:NAD(P)-dependent dehydrogenase (short-subunit alcohol dehydrogenase family)|nr:SDR family oxidoreductase [Steroidobacteraceae bacterium]